MKRIYITTSLSSSEYREMKRAAKSQKYKRIAAFVRDAINDKVFSKHVPDEMRKQILKG